MSQDAARTEILVAMSEAIHQFSLLEVQMSELFCALHNVEVGHMSHPLRHVFESVRSFDTRLSMVNVSVLQCEADPAFRRPWKWLLKDLRRLTQQRAQVAHATLIWTDAGPKLQPFLAYSSFIVEGVVRQALAIETVRAYSMDFALASGDLRNLSVYVHIARGRMVEIAEQIPDHAALLQMAPRPRNKH